MNSTLAELAARRERLLARVAAERSALAQQAAPLRAALAIADRGVDAIRYVARHPVWLFGVPLMLAVLGRGRASKWTRFAWIGWQLGRQMLRR
ncbi:MAG: YqjK-like family protein [Betaproteobacteria bacterium]|nr:YqjK-like family protein [Betaproteobacteria bacterium]